MKIKAILDFFKIKAIFDFIYDKRYIIALVLFAIIVILELSGSSIGMYADGIQPSYQERDYRPLLGKARAIRSDEWNVNTPLGVSQAIDDDSKFAYYNDNLRGTTTEMFSIAATPVADILVLAKPFFIGFLIFGAEKRTFIFMVWKSYSFNVSFI